MDLLIIGSDLQVSGALANICSSLRFKSIERCGHFEAARVFKQGKFSHVLILGYGENGPASDDGGFKTFSLLKKMMRDSSDIRIIRCGFGALPYDDYVKFPSDPAELKKKLLGR